MKVKKFNKIKHIKSMSRLLTLGQPTGTRSFKDKSKYTRKIKHKVTPTMND